MANLSKERRDRMIAKLEELKQAHNDDASIAALNEIENALREKKYGLVWEEHSEAVDDMLKDNIPVLVEDPERRLCKDENKPWNFIIEGDNLQALYLLEKTHRGKVDCIYIDPPYNTGARDWKYNNDYVDGNDEYRHSKWLSMMKSRLVVAKRLLNPRDSVLIVTIDEKEYLHLGCLLEELFPEARMQMISNVISPQGATREKQFSRTDEYIYFLAFGSAAPQPLVLSDEWSAGSSSMAGSTSLVWDSLKRRGSNSLRRDRPNLFYPLFISNDCKKVIDIGESLPPDAPRSIVRDRENCRTIWPIRSNGDEGNWQISQDQFREKYKKGYIRLGRFDDAGSMSISYLKRNEQRKVETGVFKVIGYRDDGSIITDEAETSQARVCGTQWRITSHNAGTYGSALLLKILGEKRFDFPKSLYAEHDTIRFYVANKPDAVIVDFFAGSGTTLHAVNLLNAEDGGHRRCIMVTNNEVSDMESKKLSEQGYKPGDEEWEKLGIAKYVNWPRTICAIEGVTISGEPISGVYAGTDIPMSEGFKANVKYMKCDWTPRKPEDYYLSNALCLHVKELIELQTAQEVDGVKNVLILSRSDYNRIFSDESAAAAVEKVWINQNLIFNADEMRILRTKRFRYIPREFFSQELKEAGEYV